MIVLTSRRAVPTPPRSRTTYAEPVTRSVFPKLREKRAHRVHLLQRREDAGEQVPMVHAARVNRSEAPRCRKRSRGCRVRTSSAAALSRPRQTSPALRRGHRYHGASVVTSAERGWRSRFVARRPAQLLDEELWPANCHLNYSHAEVPRRDDIAGRTVPFGGGSGPCSGTIPCRRRGTAPPVIDATKRDGESHR